MTIGNKETISFIISNYSGDLLDLSFYLGNKLISTESVYIPTYITSFVRLLKSLNDGTLKNERFKYQSPTEIFRTLKSERNSNEPEFFKHLLKLDESIDQYTIFIAETDKNVTFIWECWDKHNCNVDHNRNRVYSVKISNIELESTLQKLISELKKNTK